MGERHSPNLQGPSGDGKHRPGFGAHLRDGDIAPAFGDPSGSQGPWASFGGGGGPVWEWGHRLCP